MHKSSKCMLSRVFGYCINAYYYNNKFYVILPPNAYLLLMHKLWGLGDMSLTVFIRFIHIQMQVFLYGTVQFMQATQVVPKQASYIKQSNQCISSLTKLTFPLKSVCSDPNTVILWLYRKRSKPYRVLIKIVYTSGNAVIFISSTSTNISPTVHLV